MQAIDIIMLIVGIGLVILGYIRGFGKSLKSFTGGIMGIIISVFVCVAFGGMILGTPLVSGWISKLNELLAAKWDFLGKIQMGVIIFYVIMFALVQVVRVLIVKVICGLFEADNAVMRIINKGLGMIFVPAVVFVFLLLVLAVFKIFDGTEAMDSMMGRISGSFMAKLYDINPIVFHV